MSVVSIWECVIKQQLGKLPLPAPAPRYLVEQREKHWFETLPVTEATIKHLPMLPPLHRDPFDRLLLCQALEHGLTIVTVDAAMQAYPVQTLR